MKKLVCFILIFVVISTGCSVKKIEEVENTDAQQFKEEYESLNDRLLDVTIPEGNVIKYASFEEIMNLLDEGTGIIYFGFPECPWCRNTLPVLLNSALDTDVEEILYFNALEIRDKKHLDESGNIVVDQEGTKEYYQLVDKLSDFLSPYNGLNDSTIKRLYFPTVVFVKNGKVILLHEGTVESQKDPSIKLTKKQSDELYQIYMDGFQKVLGILCDKESAC